MSSGGGGIIAISVGTSILENNPCHRAASAFSSITPGITLTSAKRCALERFAGPLAAIANSSPAKSASVSSSSSPLLLLIVVYLTASALVIFINSLTALKVTSSSCIAPLGSSPRNLVTKSCIATVCPTVSTLNKLSSALCSSSVISQPLSLALCIIRFLTAWSLPWIFLLNVIFQPDFLTSV